MWFLIFYTIPFYTHTHTQTHIHQHTRDVSLLFSFLGMVCVQRVVSSGCADFYERIAHTPRGRWRGNFSRVAGKVLIEFAFRALAGKHESLSRAARSTQHSYTYIWICIHIYITHTSRISKWNCVHFLLNFWGNINKRAATLRGGKKWENLKARA